MSCLSMSSCECASQGHGWDGMGRSVGLRYRIGSDWIGWVGRMMDGVYPLRNVVQVHS